MADNEQGPGEPQPARETAESIHLKTAMAAIRACEIAQGIATDAKWDAELAEANALIAAYNNTELKNDAARKAAATIASAEAWRRAEIAAAKAKAASSVVDLLLGGRAR